MIEFKYDTQLLIEGKNLNDVINIANEKSNKRGAFDKKIFLEKVISKDK